MHKVVAIPVRLQRQNLSKKERAELKKKYGQQPLSPEEIEQIEKERADNEVSRALRSKRKRVKQIKSELDKMDLLYMRSLRKDDKTELKRIRDESAKLELELQQLESSNGN